jgi:hypothetical protein
VSGKAARAARIAWADWRWRKRWRKASDRPKRSCITTYYACASLRRAVHRAYAKGRRG